MQTAVEWLVEQLIELEYDLRLIPNHIKQAKEMEKEQQIDFAKHCLNKAKDLDILTSFMNAEQYYNETYGNRTENN